MSKKSTVSIRSARGVGVIASVMLMTVPLMVYSPIKDHIINAYVVFLAGSMVAAFVSRLYAQIYARAVWWLVLLSLGSLSVFIQVSSLWYDGAFDSNPKYLSLFAVFFGSVSALLCVGKSGLIQRSSLFDPKANRWPLTLSLIMGGADAMMLVLLAVTVLRSLSWTSFPNHSDLGMGASALVACLAMVTALVGVYRLRVWGVVMMLAVNSAVVVAGYAGFFVGYPGVVGSVFLCTTLVQWLLASKLASLVRKGPLFETSTPGHHDSRGVDTSEDGVTLDMSEDESHTVFEQEPVVQVAQASASE